MPPEMRTRATLRSAEFGFLGVVVYTRVQTPRRCGAATFFFRPLPDFRPGVASFLVFGCRPLRISCEVVGMRRETLAAQRPPQPSTPVASWEAPTGLDSGDPRSRRKIARAANDPTARNSDCQFCSVRFQKSEEPTYCHNDSPAWWWSSCSAL